jgi:putative peptide zinc metalloprotease protein
MMINEKSDQINSSSSDQTDNISERLYLLTMTQVFSSLGHDTMQWLANRMERNYHYPNESIVTEGDQPDRLYIISDGKAEVSVQEGDKQVVVAMLNRGELFGEIALLSADQKRDATVRAITDLKLFSLDRNIFNELLRDHPELQTAFRAIAEARKKVMFLKRFSPFKSLSPEQLRTFLERLEKVTVMQDTVIIKQGDPGDTCYMILSGRMEVSVQENKEHERKIATLYPGCVVGETALLTEEPRNATIRAIEQSELLLIKRKTLLETMKEEEGIHHQIISLLQKRDRPQRIENVIVHEQTTPEQETIRILKSPDLCIYTRLSPEGWFIWERLDGKHTLKDLTLAFMEHWKNFSPEKIAGIVSSLAQSGFIKSKTLRSDISTKKENTWGHIFQLARRLMEWNLVWKGANAFFSSTYRYGGLLVFTKASQISLALITFTGLLFFFLSYYRVAPIMYDLRESNTLLFFLVPALFIALIIHELGHGITTKHFGRDVHNAGIGWYWFGPVAFVDTTDMWTAERWPRVAVSLAGPYTNAILSGISSIIAWTSPSLIVSAVLWQFASISYINMLLNLNPLLEYDGYYILSDMLERPNLRQMSFDWLGKYLKGNLKKPYNLHHHWFDILYGCSSIAYVGIMAYLVVVSYRILLETHLKKILPYGIASALPWMLAFAIIFSACIIILGDMKIVKMRSQKA